MAYIAVDCDTACPTNIIRIKSPACSTFLATHRTALSAAMPLPMPGPMPPNPIQIPAPNSAMEALSAVDSGNDLNINIKLTNSPKIAGVWDTACPTNIMVVTFGAVLGCRAMPSQLAPAANPPPYPEPMAASPILKPAPRYAAQVGDNGAFPKSMNISIKATTMANMAGV